MYKLKQNYVSYNSTNLSLSTNICGIVLSNKNFGTYII